MPVEFRVRWRRDGRQPAYRIYQSEDAAWRKACAVRALEDVKHEFSQYDGMPDLVEGPDLQVRGVSEWRPSEQQPEPMDYHRDRMREHARDYAPLDEEERAREIPF
jgi:hypothetical protein